MKIAVLVKRVPDTATRFQIVDGGARVDAPGIKYIVNPYDEFAVEEAVQIKERTPGATVTVVCLGDDKSVEIIHKALAFGCDDALLLNDPLFEAADQNGVARALAAGLKTIAPDLVLAGKQAVDDDARQVPERVAELLGMTHVGNAVKLVLNGGEALATREIDGGSADILVALPAVISTNRGINKPRYPKLPNIMKAKKLPLKKLTAADLALSAADLQSGLKLVNYSLPPEPQPGRKLAGDIAAASLELAQILTQQEKLIK
ncbi:MAG: electron transfer flavoprotein subunit beta/FixA family protein [Planctomycetota bacterium]